MRIIHRYLGFFLTGIMAIYAISGIVLIFRNTDLFKKETHKQETVGAGLNDKQLGEKIRMRGLKFDKEENGVMLFKDGSYNSTTGEVAFTTKELPFILEKLTHLHKANTKEPLFFLNIFFGLSLFFFVISSFWMFTPKTKTFRTGLYFTAGGIVLTLILLFV